MNNPIIVTGLCGECPLLITVRVAAAGTPAAATRLVAGKTTNMTLSPVSPRQHHVWSLLINAFVEIRQNGKIIRTGIVEDAMPDSSIVWVAGDGIRSRQMFEVSQGHQVWVAPQELSGDLNYRMTTKQACGGLSSGRR